LDYINIKRYSEVEELIEEKPEMGGRTILFLDGITDPQNFGSILRSAMFLGVDAIIVNRKNACGLTPAVSKVSSGALEFLPLFSIKYVRELFEDMKKNHNFRIISTNIDEEQPDTLKEMDIAREKMKEALAAQKKGESKESSSSRKEPGTFAKQDEDLYQASIAFGGKGGSKKTLTSLTDLNIGAKEDILIILGSEGEGVSRTISVLADDRVTLPPRFNMDLIGKYPFHMIDSLNVGVSAALMISTLHQKRIQSIEELSAAGSAAQSEK